MRSEVWECRYGDLEEKRTNGEHQFHKHSGTERGHGIDIPYTFVLPFRPLSPGKSSLEVHPTCETYNTTHPSGETMGNNQP